MRAIVAVLAAVGLATFGNMLALANSLVPGHYTGASDAYTGATVSFDVDAGAALPNFATQSYIQCGLFPVAMQWTGMPHTSITAGQPFKVMWSYGTGGDEVQYELEGVVRSDGTAQGEGIASMPGLSCQGYRFEWNASTEAPPPEPEPTPDPTPGPTAGPTPGPSPVQIPAVTPAASELTAEVRGGIEVPGTVDEGSLVVVEMDAEHAGNTVVVWLFSDPAYLGTRVVNESGQVTLEMPQGATGEHRIAVYAADGSLVGWADLVIVPDHGPSPRSWD